MKRILYKVTLGGGWFHGTQLTKEYRIVADADASLDDIVARAHEARKERAHIGRNQPSGTYEQLLGVEVEHAAVYDIREA